MEVIRFGATWCAPCKAMAVVLPKVIAGFEGVTYRQVDVEQEEFDADKYSFMSIPYVAIQDSDGQVLKSFTGKKTTTEVAEMLSGLGAKPISPPT